MKRGAQRPSVTIDGSMGEGGGQVLRTTLALSLCLGMPVHLTKIRAGRPKPGLRRQHLAAVRGAARVSGARVTGDVLGSDELTFAPRRVAPGNYHFDVGSAGSATLVLQTVLPPLLTADGPSELVVGGGTHNPFAPPYDFLERAFLPLLSRMGPQIEARLEMPGFYPAGGGRVRLRVHPVRRLKPLTLLDRGRVVRVSAEALVAGLPAHIGERELRVIGRRLDLEPDALTLRPMENGPGNAALVVVESAHVTEVFTAFGRRGLRAETVAERAADGAARYLAAGVPVGPHLADQLLLPLALAGGGEFRTLAPSRHALTNGLLIERLTGMRVSFETETDDVCRVVVGAGDG